MWQKMLQVGSGGSGSSSFQFSTDEQKTNLKWLNGEDIYCKTFKKTSDISFGMAVGTLPSTYNVIQIDGYINRSNGAVVPANYYSTTTFYTSTFIGVNSNILFEYGTSVGPASITVTVYYTKS